MQELEPEIHRMQDVSLCLFGFGRTQLRLRRTDNQQPQPPQHPNTFSFVRPPLLLFAILPSASAVNRFCFLQWSLRWLYYDTSIIHRSNRTNNFSSNVNNGLLHARLGHNRRLHHRPQRCSVAIVERRHPRSIRYSLFLRRAAKEYFTGLIATVEMVLCRRILFNF